MCGIFGYLYNSTDGSVSVQHVVDTLLGGLQKLEYRGYDSAGICIDPHGDGASLVVKSTGKISALRAKAYATLKKGDVELDRPLANQIGIGHTRWATHGPPSDINSHPHVSSDAAEFVVVHNGIISNYTQLKTFLVGKGFTFVSETDTEVVPKLLMYLHQQHQGSISLPRLAMEVMLHLEGAFALLIKSTTFYPGQLVACKRGSPLVYATKAAQQGGASMEDLLKSGGAKPGVNEVWLASDAAALLTHSREMTVLDDEDLLHVGADGSLAHFNLGSLKGTVAAGAQPGALRGLAANLGRDLSVTRLARTVSMELESVMKGGYDHYMQKEIHEQPKSLADTMTGRVIIEKPMQPASFFESFSNGNLSQLSSTSSGGGKGSPTLSRWSLQLERSGSDDELPSGPNSGPHSGLLKHGSGAGGWAEAASTAGPHVRLGGLLDHLEAIRSCRRLLFIACGTSYHACLAARATLEEFAAMPVVLELAGDFMDREAPIFRDDTCVFVSQSGETADTLRALDYAKSKGALCVGITNTVGSAISRQTHAGVHLNAGFEIGVASTKAYTSQVVALTMMALLLGADSRAKSSKREEVVRALAELPQVITESLKLDGNMKKLAEELKEAHDLLFFGRGYNYATALEAALKVKEVALIHSEGINAGEMKHGPLALVDEHLPIVVLATKDNMHRKMDSVIQQLLARNAKLYIVCNKDDPVMGKYVAAGCRLIEVPHTVDALQPVVNVVPLQLLSYHLTVLRGFDVDQPRNLAKSVTVTED